MFWSTLILFVSLVGLGVVAFLTLLERKVLGLSQCRLGPNKLSLYGLMQPVVDGIKLLCKDSFRPINSQVLLFYSSPLLLLFLFLVMWSFMIPWNGSSYKTKNSLLLFFCFLAIMAYALVLAGWSSTSSFSKMGGYRGILQSLSYEVALILVFLWVIAFYWSFNLINFNSLSLELSASWLSLMFMLSLMEGNRAPFDLLEGESELISGFNIEMGSMMFVCLFLSEYGMIPLMSIIMSLLSTGSMALVLILGLVCLTLFMRSCYPRIRYDVLMSFMWKSFLPVSVFLVSWGLLLK